MRRRVAKVCPAFNKATRVISPKSSCPEVGLTSGDYCIWQTVFPTSSATMWREVRENFTCTVSIDLPSSQHPGTIGVLAGKRTEEESRRY